jgi:hypothetical protein
VFSRLQGVSHLLPYLIPQNERSYHFVLKKPERKADSTNRGSVISGSDGYLIVPPKGFRSVRSGP